MTADAGQRGTAFRNLGRRIVRAARTEIGHAAHTICGIADQRRFLEHTRAVGDGEIGPHPRQPFRQRREQGGRPMLAECRDQRRAIQVAAAGHARPAVGHPVEQDVLDLILDQARLLFDDQDVLEPARKRFERGAVDREDQPGFPDSNALPRQDIRRQAGARQRLQRIAGILSDRDDANLGAVGIDQCPIQRICPCKGRDRLQPSRHAHFDRQCQEIARAVAEPIRWKTLRQFKTRQRAIDETAAAFDGLGDRLEGDPGSGKARGRPAPQAKGYIFVDAGGMDDRDAPPHQREIARIGNGRGSCGMIVADHQQNPALFRRTGGVAVPNRIAGAVDAGALAVPQRKHAIDGAGRIVADALRARDGGCGEILVHRRENLISCAASAALARHNPVSTPASGDPR